jgi:hypothetical protein
MSKKNKVVSDGPQMSKLKLVVSEVLVYLMK